MYTMLCNYFLTIYRTDILTMYQQYREQ